LKEIGKENEVEIIIPNPIGLIMYEDEKGKIRKLERGTSFLKMLKALNVKLWNLKEIFQTIKFLRKLMKISSKEIENLYDVSSMDYVN